MLGHFVDRARSHGHSWTEISGALGVSKQAVHKRFGSALAGPLAAALHDLFSSVEGKPPLEQLTPRTRNCVRAASERAAELGHRHIGTEHLLLGFFAEPECVAAKVLDQHGLTQETVEAAVSTVVRSTPTAEPGEPQLTPLAKKALEQTLNIALELGHNYIGTEHLLIALYRQPEGLASTILVENGLDEATARAAVIEALSGYRRV